jgi:ArsR family transcriptional regulator
MSLQVVATPPQERKGCGGETIRPLPDERLLKESVLLLKGFADVTRLTILSLLQEGEVCVHDIVEALDISQSGVSHQLRILRDARLVSRRKEGRHVFYRLADKHVELLLDNALSHGEEAI